MVYGGKPSRGCLTCRARRIKCDEGKPTCKNCAKSKRDCAGYKAEFDIVHRDETGRVARKMRRRGVVVDDPPPNPSRPSNPAGSSTTSPLQIARASPSSSSSGPSASREVASPAPSLPVSPTAQAEGYFASNFILVTVGPPSGPDGGYLEYLAPLIDREPAGSALRHAFDACALAAWGNRRKDERLTDMALREHTYALAGVHMALGDSTTVHRESTLAAILLLSLYENITATREVRMYAWRSHIEAAVRLVRARGRELRRTPLGKLLFHAVRYNLVSRSLSSGIAPEMGAEFWTRDDDPASLMAGCHRLCLKTGELRAEVARRMASVGADRTAVNVEAMLGLARAVQAFDQEVATWLVRVPPEARFQTLCWVGDDGEVEGLGSGSPRSRIIADGQEGREEEPSLRTREAFPGRLDVYPDVLAAWCWNQARVARLILASLNIRLAAWLCSPVDYRATAEYATSRRICEGTIAEVVASIPYHLSWHLRPHRKALFGRPEFAGFACGRPGPLKALPAFFAIWPLACVRNHDITTEDQREWCRGRLRFIADELGLKYADLLYQAEIRFPSMLIRQDGMANNMDFTTLPLRPKMAPPDPPPLAISRPN